MKGFAFLLLPATLLVVDATMAVDYVIVGAGTSGLVIANRLSQNKNITVALIDPGSDERGNPTVSDPSEWLKLQQTPINWNYTSVPQETANGRAISYPAGKGIGGTSLMNGSLHCRPFLTPWLTGICRYDVLARR